MGTVAIICCIMKGLAMKRLLMALLIAMVPLSAAHSGTFLDDFHDRNLDGWHLSISPPGIDLPVSFKDGYLVIDTTIEKNELPEGEFKFVSLELSTGNAEDWNAYTLTCRIRFGGAPQEEDGLFGIGVRRGKGQFDVVAEQRLLISPADHHVQISTTPPDAKRDAALGLEGRIVREIFGLRELRRPIKLNRWLPIQIVAEEDYFEFHFDDNFVSQYQDEKAIPGTVQFQADSGMLVHLDDVTITGPDVPNIGSPQSVNSEAHLATTWGMLKNSRRR